MNRVRRDQLRAAYGRLKNCIEDLCYIRDEEENALDNVPENLQGSDATEQMEEAVNNIDDAIECIDEALNYLDEVI